MIGPICPLIASAGCEAATPMAASFSSRQGAFVVGLVGAPLAGAPFSGQSSAGGEAFQLTRGRMQPLVATLRNGRRPRATVCVRDGACTGWYASPAARLTRPYNRHLASAGRGMPRPYREHDGGRWTRIYDPGRAQKRIQALSPPK